MIGRPRIENVTASDLAEICPRCGLKKWDAMWEYVDGGGSAPWACRVDGTKLYHARLHECPTDKEAE